MRGNYLVICYVRERERERERECWCYVVKDRESICIVWIMKWKCYEFKDSRYNIGQNHVGIDDVERERKLIHFVKRDRDKVRESFI